MIIVEHDAKELLAVQGIPMPGGVMLRQTPKYDGAGDATAGPWLVKAQVPGAPHASSSTPVTAHNAREVAAAAHGLLGTHIDGCAVSAVRVERQLTAAHRAYLCFDCDLATAGVRISVGAGAAGDSAASALSLDTLQTETVVPDANAVIACASRLAVRLPDGIRNQVSAAARQLAPLFFGYEATVIEIDPLMIFEDGSWMVGNVNMQIDENALFRHPELIAIMDRRDDNYSDTRQRRDLGLDFSVVDENGTVGLLTNGTALALYLMNEIGARGLSPYNFIDLRASRITDGSECLRTALEWIAAGPNVRTVLVNLISGASEMTEIAETLGQVLVQSAIDVPVVIRLAGCESKQIEQHFSAVETEIILVSDLHAALQRIEQCASTQAPR